MAWGWQVSVSFVVGNNIWQLCSLKNCPLPLIVSQSIHKELEAKIAEFHGMESSILYAACFDANAGLFETLLGPEDAVISDSLNHASIIDGIRLCKAKRFRYDHMDMGQLEKHLQESQSARHRMIVTDGVFSMDGHIAPLKEICDLADKYLIFHSPLLVS